MKILLVSTNYTGGAAIACRRQHKALLEQGVDSRLLVLDKISSPSEKNVYSIEELISKKYGRIYFLVLKYANRLLNKLPTLLNKKMYINGPMSLFRIDKLAIYQEAGIIHLHWTPKIISYKHIFKNKKKVFFWTLHDMNPFTGGNHYVTDMNYEPYKKLLRKNIEKKKRYLEGADLTVVSVSSWLSKLAKESEVFKHFPVEVIPNCIDTSIFKPTGKTAARKKLNIGFDDKKYILFVAENPDDKRKGMNLLFTALDRIADKSKFVVLIIGKKLEKTDFKFEVKQLGFIKNDTDMVDCYNAADFFVIPSIEDNLPNTVLESLACGTPVIGYNIGGIPDMVINNETGLLSDLNDEKAFVHNIESFIELNDYTAFSVKGRAKVEKEFSEQKIMQQLINLYRSRYNK